MTAARVIVRHLAPLILAAACREESVAGAVLDVDLDGVTLSSDAARRWPIQPVLAAQIHEGDKITADLDIDGVITRVRFLRRAEPARDPALLPPGAALPARLIPGVDGPFPLGEGQGEPTALAFFYTSCGVPTACPMLTARLMELQVALRGRGHIATITLDPERDTLETLRTFAVQRGIDRQVWRLGRLEASELDPLLRSLGVTRLTSGGEIQHDLDVVLLDAGGRVVWNSDGRPWTAPGLVARLDPNGPE
ncbi:MAG TPA: SCO family protein [Myxococcota bacterium]|nr:SCO family protein [Myxococcota bacterium]